MSVGVWARTGNRNQSAWRQPSLPNAHALSGWQVIPVGGLHTKRCVPIVDVAQRCIGTYRRGCMGICRDLFAQRILAHFSLPALRPAQEKPLLAAETVEHRSVTGAQ